MAFLLSGERGRAPTPILAALVLPMEDLSLAQRHQVAAVAPVLARDLLLRDREAPRPQLAEVDAEEDRAIDAVVAEGRQQRGQRAEQDDAAALHAGTEADARLAED